MLLEVRIGVKGGGGVTMGVLKRGGGSTGGFKGRGFKGWGGSIPGAFAKPAVAVIPAGLGKLGRIHPAGASPLPLPTLPCRPEAGSDRLLRFCSRPSLCSRNLFSPLSHASRLPCNRLPCNRLPCGGAVKSLAPYALAALTLSRA